MVHIFVESYPGRDRQHLESSLEVFLFWSGYLHRTVDS